MKVTRLFDLLPNYKESFIQKDDALAGKENGKWVKYSIDDYIEYANNVSYGLMKLGVGPGDKVATISNNRPEWNFLDMGILQIGAIHVPIYPTISESDYKYILKHSEVKYVFVSSKELLKKIEPILPEAPNIKGIYTFNQIEGVDHYSKVVALGKENPVPDELEKVKAMVKPDDVATLIYTSGTTGDPKGVLLSHNNIMSNVHGCFHVFPVDDTCKGISYLPLCHVYERMALYVYQFKGVSVYYAENMATIADNIREIQPEIFCTVPRLLEKVYDKIVAKGMKLKGIKKVMFFWALNLGLRYELNGANGWWYEFQLGIANKLVFSKWREALGGNIRCSVSGGAALQARLARVFTAAGIPPLEGYGLTETSPVIALNNLDKNGRYFGTVGIPLKDVEVKIAEDGEILARGPNVMQGYYKDPEMTAEAIDKDGWFHTGDIGTMVEDRYLKITGRKKEIFKTSFGKYISPQPIENRFKESAFIDTIMVLGENQKFAGALIVPDFIHLKSWCKIKEIAYSSNAEMINNQVVKKRFQVEVDKYNKFFGDTEKIKKFDLLDHEWSVDSGELTANLKVKRNFICEQYRTKIEKLFGIS